MVDFKHNNSYGKTFSFIWALDDTTVWIEIPKNGSAAIKTTRFGFIVVNNKGTILPPSKRCSLQPIEVSDIAKYRKGFIILRDPIKRFKSNIAYFFSGGIKQHLGREWMIRNGFLDKNSEIKVFKNIPIEDKIDLILNNWSKMDNFDGIHHFNSQAHFIPPEFDNLKYRMAFEMKDLSRIFGFEEKINYSSSSTVLINNEQKAIIKELYKEDYDLIEKYL